MPLPPWRCFGVRHSILVSTILASYLTFLSCVAGPPLAHLLPPWSSPLLSMVCSHDRLPPLAALFPAPGLSVVCFPPPRRWRFFTTCPSSVSVSHPYSAVLWLCSFPSWTGFYLLHLSARYVTRVPFEALNTCRTPFSPRLYSAMTTRFRTPAPYPVFALRSVPRYAFRFALHTGASCCIAWCASCWMHCTLGRMGVMPDLSMAGAFPA